MRLEPAGAGGPDLVRVRFDYDGGTSSLGDTMRRHEGQHLVDLHRGSHAFRSSGARDSERSTGESYNPHHAPSQRPNLSRSRQSRPSPSSSRIRVPLVGVLFFGWDLGDVMVLYWVESGIIAFYTVLKIAIVGKLAALRRGPVFCRPPRRLHDGALPAHPQPVSSRGSCPGVLTVPPRSSRAIFVPIWTSIAALFISHGVSFVTNFIGQREYGRCVSELALMTAPYNRIIVMHLTLIFGGWIVLLIGMPTGALVLLLALKTALDLHAHRKEHGG